MDITEKSFEDIIFNNFININGFVEGKSEDFDPEFAIDTTKVTQFIKQTQPKIYEYFQLDKPDSPKRKKLLHRIQTQINQKGIKEVLLNGVKEGAYKIDLYYPLPSEKNKTAQENYQKNIFSITRQLKYSSKNNNSLDLVIFINGLPIITFELKNRFTKQTVEDAIKQYKQDRDPREEIFKFGKFIVHFAVDDKEVYMTTHLQGKNTIFFPFNKGHNNGAGNPPNPNGIATEYLWKEILTKGSLSDIIENYVNIFEIKDKKTKKKKKVLIFPRYHQLDAVRKLTSDIVQKEVGQRYLIQHSAGSGKSNTITWLARKLIELEKDQNTIFNTIFVITDRKVLDKQIKDNLKKFIKLQDILGIADSSKKLKEFIEKGKKIIITTIQKFPYVIEEIGDKHRNRNFAVIIDEAHSSQGGNLSAKLNYTLAQNVKKYNASQIQDEEDIEDYINQIIESKKFLSNVSYFAFTATPKNKTLELFGTKYEEAGQTKYKPFHLYSMKQAIEEGFILDVLENYVPVKSYYKLIKKVEENPEFDEKTAIKKLKKFVENHDTAIRKKAEIMIDHFHKHTRFKMNGKARAMVITSSRQQALKYFLSFNEYLRQINSLYKAIIAFSGELEYNGEKITENHLNGFPSSQIEDKFIEEPYRFLIVADKFLTGFDEPLLHTLYVDKYLSGVKAVQTLSRVNRTHPAKTDTFILDFVNDPDEIKKAFEPYYTATILSDKTDPNRLHDLKDELDDYGIYTQEEINKVVKIYLTDNNRRKLDSILDRIAIRFKEELDEDQQINFKRKAKSYLRTYNFLSSILDFSNPDWEKFSIFLNLLLPKLPILKYEDLSKGITKYVNLESYRVEIKQKTRIKLEENKGELKPLSDVEESKIPEPEIKPLDIILNRFNQLFGDMNIKDKEKLKEFVIEEIPQKVLQNENLQLALKNNDEQNIKIELERAIQDVILSNIDDNLELFKYFSDNNEFRKSFLTLISDIVEVKLKNQSINIK